MEGQKNGRQLGNGGYFTLWSLYFIKRHTYKETKYRKKYCDPKSKYYNFSVLIKYAFGDVRLVVKTRVANIHLWTKTVNFTILNSRNSWKVKREL